MTKRTLLMDVKVGESLSIDGGRIVITIEEKSGQRVKCRIVHEDATIERARKPAPEPDRKPAAFGRQHAMWGTKAAA